MQAQLADLDAASDWDNMTFEKELAANPGVCVCVCVGVCVHTGQLLICLSWLDVCADATYVSSYWDLAHLIC